MSVLEGLSQELVQYPKPRHLFWLSPLLGKPRRQSFQDARDRGVVLQYRHRRLADRDLVIGEDSEISLGLQAAQRLTQRNPTDLQRRGKLLLGKPFSWSEFSCDNRRFQLLGKQPRKRSEALFYTARPPHHHSFSFLLGAIFSPVGNKRPRVSSLLRASLTFRRWLFTVNR